MKENFAKKKKKPTQKQDRATFQTLEASVNMLNPVIHDSHIMKRNEQVWLIWQHCQGNAPQDLRTLQCKPLSKPWTLLYTKGFLGQLRGCLQLKLAKNHATEK